MRALSILVLISCFQFLASAQNSDRLSDRLDSISEVLPVLSDTISLSFTGELADFVNYYAGSSKVNLTLGPGAKGRLDNAFVNVTHADIIKYICMNNDLEPGLIGNIIRLSPTPTPKSIIKVPDIRYDASKLFNVDLKNDTLLDVMRKVVDYSNVNVVLSGIPNDMLVSGSYRNADALELLKFLSISNNLDYEVDNKGEVVTIGASKQSEDSERTTPTIRRNSNIDLLEDGLISVRAIDQDPLLLALDIMRAASINYYVLPGVFPKGSANRTQSANQRKSALPPPSTINLLMDSVLVEEVLEYLASNTSYDIVLEGDMYVVGGRDSEGITEVRVKQLQNRNAQSVIGAIPEWYFSQITIDSMYEHNSLILTGNPGVLEELELFIDEIDLTVPVVMIELIIVDIQEGRLREIGVEAGVSSERNAVGGNIVSGNADEQSFNFNFSPNSINQLLDLLSGRGIINLGRVSSDFYLNLKAVEEQGFIEIESTPKLSTLNSHQATLSIGQKRYYLEQQVNFSGFDRPIPVQSNNFREVEANLDIKIRPTVSGDKQVTLNIDFEQSEFLGEFDVTVPPPQISRKFQSMIRVSEDEMVVLGGLERRTNSRTKRGLPWLSRIPLLGWMFGRHSRNNNEDKLLIFIKPTVLE